MMQDLGARRVIEEIMRFVHRFELHPHEAPAPATTAGEPCDAPRP